MGSLFRRWKNRLRCSSKRYMHRSGSSILVDNDVKEILLNLLKNNDNFYLV